MGNMGMGGGDMMGMGQGMGGEQHAGPGSAVPCAVLCRALCMLCYCLQGGCPLAKLLLRCTAECVHCP